MSTDQWIQLAIQIAISIPGAVVIGFGVYLGMVKAQVKVEGRVDKVEGRVTQCEGRLDRLEAPFFDHRVQPSK